MEALSSLPALVAAVQAQKLRFKRRQQPPLSVVAQDKLKSRVADTLSYELPQAYLDILAVTDGLDWNGEVLYASETRLLANDELDIQGLVEANTQLRLAYTPDKDFIYFAESGTDAYRHNIMTGKFEISDRVVGASIFETFNTAEELFQQLFKNMLNLGNAEDDTP
jgi:hypothetical protein